MPTDKQLANDLVHTNNEYQKLKGSRLDSDKTPRETPAGQGAGRRGYSKQLFDEWTREELVTHARTLGLQADESSSREDLIEQIESRDATIARGSGS
ncbi:hypothetical protein ACUNV4_06770 [Granulosicoccus sp. 3-233]|uniref:hypothetical protein n=1 Tax=Granulosicoccus sp. 3-233 TaxID=3417969 RepID=UPI003D34CDD7